MISRRNLLLSGVALAIALPFAASAQTVAAQAEDKKPALFLIGDSTIRNGTGDNGATAGQFGWGRMMKYYFDTDRIHVVNDAMGGTSSRSFQEAPRLWGNVVRMIRPGDFVLMAFGHNDSRGSKAGNGDETSQLEIPARRNGAGREEPAQSLTVHSFGWYMRQFIKQVRAKGATPIVLSLIPRNRWTDGKVGRNSADYALWAKQAADQEKAQFIPLNDLIADKYDKLGQAKVTAELFPPNETVHPNWAGSSINAATVVEGLKALDTPLKRYLRANPQVPATPDIQPTETGDPGPGGMMPKSRTPAPEAPAQPS